MTTTGSSRAALLKRNHAAGSPPPPGLSGTGVPGIPGGLGGIQLGTGAGNGAVRNSTVYYDHTGRRRTAATPVPVDQYGQIAGVQFRCRKCQATRWFPTATAAKGNPACETDGYQMVRMDVPGSGLVPWGAIRTEIEPQMRAVWGLAVAVAAGAGVHYGHVSPAGLAAAAVPAGLIASRWLRTWLTTRAERKGHRDAAHPGTRRHTATARRGKAVGCYTVLGVLWLAGTAVLGLDPETVGGRVALTALVVLWLPPAAAWWRWKRRLRANRNQPQEPDTEAPVDDDIPMDPDEAQTRWVWNTIIAAVKDQIISTRPDGTEVKAARNGKLVSTRLEDWHTVVGGWAATIVGPDGVYTADTLMAARGAIASAFRMKAAMITVIPDPDDENRAMVLAQRTSPIRDVVRWSGPDSIDSERGTAEFARYADGGTAMYEVYRPEWGSPHVLMCGTTGSGKSDGLALLFTIDRWTSHLDPATGQRRGLVASFLIEPQQGQSFAPFLDDLAGPVASTLDEATLLVEAMTREMLRRNRYLAREAKTWDAKRNKWRTGRKWWNPLVDGPILTLTIDEAHAYLSDRKFCEKVTAAARMWRKCGGQIRVATHTPLLSDLGGSMALRDMLTGGFVAVYRTANSLSGPVAFNGRLPADPRTIPDDPGSCYVITGEQPKAMLARAEWEPDWYDHVRDLNDDPIGYPATLPPETLAAFGPDYAAWVEHAADPDAGLFILTQPAKPVEVEAPASCVDAVFLILVEHSRNPNAGSPTMSMEDLDKALRDRGMTYSTRTVRDALAKLRKAGRVRSGDGRHQLTATALDELDDDELATADSGSYVG